VQQLQSNVLQPSSAAQQQQFDQVLAALGVTHQRLALGAPPLLQPVVNALPADLRVLLVHYSSELQQLLVLGVTPDPAEAAAAAAGADKPKPKDPKAAAAAAPPVKRVNLLGSIKLTADQMADLVRGFKEYRQWLQRYVLELSGVPLEGTLSAAGAAAAAAAEAEAAAAAAEHGGKGSPGKKGAAGAKGGRESPTKGAKPDPKAKGAAADAGAAGLPPWIPAGKVYGAEPNNRWRELVAQVRERALTNGCCMPLSFVGWSLPVSKAPNCCHPCLQHEPVCMCCAGIFLCTAASAVCTTAAMCCACAYSHHNNYS
jgi:ribosomal protein L12E/L44/L45/RPP1/RPP2